MMNRAPMTTRARRAVPALLLLTAACSAVTPTASPSAEATAPPRPQIVVGSGPSVELQLMSELYAQVLEASGYEVTRVAPAADVAAVLGSLRDADVDLAA